MHGNEVLSVTTELVNLDLEMGQMSLAICLPLPGCVALSQNGLWKHGADEAVADRSQGSHSDKSCVI